MGQRGGRHPGLFHHPAGQLGHHGSMAMPRRMHLLPVPAIGAPDCGRSLVGTCFKCENHSFIRQHRHGKKQTLSGILADNS